MRAGGLPKARENARLKAAAPENPVRAAMSAICLRLLTWIAAPPPAPIAATW